MEFNLTILPFFQTSGEFIEYYCSQRICQEHCETLYHFQIKPTKWFFIPSDKIKSEKFYVKLAYVCWKIIKSPRITFKGTCSCSRSFSSLFSLPLPFLSSIGAPSSLHNLLKSSITIAFDYLRHSRKPLPPPLPLPLPSRGAEQQGGNKSRWASRARGRRGPGPAIATHQRHY